MILCSVARAPHHRIRVADSAPTLFQLCVFLKSMCWSCHMTFWIGRIRLRAKEEEDGLDAL